MMMMMLRGDPSKQEHYVAGRNITTVNKSDIEGICDCGYLTLKASNEFENFNGGLTVKRSKVKIVNDEGNTVQRLRGKQFNHYGCCNACVNHWK